MSTEVLPAYADANQALADGTKFLDEGQIDKAPFAAAIDDFYLTNPIARASAVMGECSALAEARTAMTAAE